MSPRPTGRVRSTATGADLVITRSFRAPIEDVWQSVTASESTARWIGPWEGEAGPGKTVRLQMAFEQGAPWCDFSIDTCEPPHRLALSAKDDHGEWRLELSLAASRRVPPNRAASSGFRAVTITLTIFGRKSSTIVNTKSVRA